MGYLDLYKESQQQATDSLIAERMLSHLEDQRGKIGVGDSKVNLSRRWVWELIQNAKDAHNGRVSISVDFKNDSTDKFVKFRHNGQPFTTSNLRFLIEMISDKPRRNVEGQRRKHTGKFGTGFITTHLLSELVTVNGIIKEPRQDFKKFEMLLDRTGIEPEQVTKAVRESQKVFENLDKLPSHSYDAADYNTTFTYPLEDDVSINVAEAGIEDLQIGIQYTFLFVPEIEKVEVPSLNRIFINNSNGEVQEETVSIISILVTNNAGTKQRALKFAVLRSGFTSIAVPIEEKEGAVSISEIDERMPRIFCDFPLVGTEGFPLPVIMNNPNLNPTDPRDGIFLTSNERGNPKIEENKEIVKEAVSLFKKLLKYASANKWSNLHELAKVNEYSIVPSWIEKKWLTDNLVNPIREEILSIPIVTAANGELRPILEKGNKAVYFPTAAKKEIKEAIWEAASKWFPHGIPARNHVELWSGIIWGECGKLTLDVFAQFVKGRENIENLKEVLHKINPNADAFQWLNHYYDMNWLDDKEFSNILRKYAIFPNQNGAFRLLNELFQESGAVDPEFKEILVLLGNDVKAKFLDNRITSMEQNESHKKDESYFIKEIITEVTTKTNDRVKAKSYTDAFQRLLQWFRKHPTKAQEVFPSLYENLHLLYDDEQIMKNIEKAEELNELMNEFNIKDVTTLRQMLSTNSNGSLLPVTQEIIASMGISNIDEWREAIKDQNLAAIYGHESTPTTDMFFYAQGLIERAKTAILDHLATLQEYDISNPETIAPTLLGVIKNGQPVTIVARPAYNGEVIIYYGAEKDQLDFDPSAELWVDEGTSQRRISLGHILKKGRITKFPV